MDRDILKKKISDITVEELIMVVQQAIDEEAERRAQDEYAQAIRGLVEDLTTTRPEIVGRVKNALIRYARIEQRRDDGYINVADISRSKLEELCHICEETVEVIEEIVIDAGSVLKP